MGGVGALYLVTMPYPYSEAARLLGERIKLARVELGLSQEDFAELAQMHSTNFGKIERGVANPRIATLIRIAGVLEQDIGELIGGITHRQLPKDMEVLPASEFVRARDRWRRRNR